MYVSNVMYIHTRRLYEYTIKPRGLMSGRAGAENDALRRQHHLIQERFCDRHRLWQLERRLEDEKRRTATLQRDLDRQRHGPDTSSKPEPKQLEFEDVEAGGLWVWNLCEAMRLLHREEMRLATSEAHAHEARPLEWHSVLVRKELRRAEKASEASESSWKPSIFMRCRTPSRF